jgi:selenocysteine lyase/cysteine desulfurase
VDGTERPYLSFDAAASTGALSQVLARVEAFVPWYSSVHRGAGYKSQLATAAYEDARAAALSFARVAAAPGTGGPPAMTWRSSDPMRAGPLLSSAR